MKNVTVIQYFMIPFLKQPREIPITTLQEASPVPLCLPASPHPPMTASNTGVYLCRNIFPSNLVSAAFRSVSPLGCGEGFRGGVVMVEKREMHIGLAKRALSLH